MKSLKLNKIEGNRLDKKEMNHLCGGNTCGCGCLHENSGGSTRCANAAANFKGGLTSTGVKPMNVSSLGEYLFWYGC
ncbi:MAG: TIGR04149 family rSAM-modified RiPP [Bacteroidales bacterium]